MNPRRITPEILDSLPSSDPDAQASRRDLQRLHSILGQKKLWLRWFREKYTNRPPSSLVDLGSGDGHLLSRILPLAFPSGGGGTRLFFVDRQPSVADSSLDQLRRQNWLPTIIDCEVLEWARQAPPADLILSNLFLHHLSVEKLRELFLHLARITPLFAAAEPARNWPASFGCRLLPLLGCHPVTLHDSRVSVAAGFRDEELSELWPKLPLWHTSESASGLFTHFFSAEKSS